MASDQERNAERKNLSVSDYGARAAFAVDTLVPGPNRDKKVARLFSISVRMAQLLRAGRFWTTERLSQASRLLGSDFDALLADPSLLRARLCELEREIADIRNRLGGG